MGPVPQPWLSTGIPRREQLVGGICLASPMKSSLVAVGTLVSGDLVTEVDTPGGPWYRVVAYDNDRGVLTLDEGVDVPVDASTARVLRRSAHG